MNTNKFESCIFSPYAFVGWLWTIAVNNHEVLPPGTRTTGPVCPPEFAWLGDTPLGWRFDAALRKGWSMLEADALEFAVENLLPLCDEWIKDVLFNRCRSK